MAISSGCGSKAKGERRLSGIDTSAPMVAGEGDSTRTGGHFAPNGAPGVDSFGSGTDVARGGSSGVGLDGANALDATGSLPNNVAAGGVEFAAISGDLDMVHFAYDSYDITPEWQTVLDGHAEWIKQNAGVDIQIEGHCDERGTEEYNISLGQKRADAVRTYLVGRGVDEARLTTISYGKMRPIQAGGDEESHAVNRRAMFLVFEPTNGTVASN